MGKNFKVGEAPWEIREQLAEGMAAGMTGTTPPSSFAVGQAPWEQQDQAPATLPTEETNAFNAAESALQGMGQGIGFGYLPEMQAGLEVGLSKILPEKWGGNKQLKFKDALKNWRKRDVAIQTEDPLAYGGGSVVGALTAPIPGAGTLKALGFGGKLLKGAKAAKAAQTTAKAAETTKAVVTAAEAAKAAKTATTLAEAANVAKNTSALGNVAKTMGTGALAGFIQNPGETDDQFKARVEQALTGGAIGGALHGAGAGISKLKTSLKKGREALAMKLAGGRKAHFKEFPAGTPKREELIGFMEKEGMTKPGQSFETVNEKASQIVEDTGQKLGDVHTSINDDVNKIQQVLQKSEEAGIGRVAEKLTRDSRFNARDIAVDVLKKARKEFRGKAGGRDALRSLRKEMENLAILSRGGKDANFKEVLDYRKSLDDVINYQKGFMDSKTNEKALKFARNVIKENMDKRIQNLDTLIKTHGNKEAANRVATLKKLNDRYSKASALKRISADRMAGEESKVNLGLLETIAGTGYAGAEIARGEDPTKALTKGLVGGLALRQARKYGPGLTYSAFKRAESLGRAGDALQKVPPRALVTPWLLMNRGDGNGNK